METRIEPHFTQPPRRWKWHLAGLFLLSFVVGICFLQSPRFGDDFTYWSFAFDLHERGTKALKAESFHDLRWPVWGICWLLQFIFNLNSFFDLGVGSYYGEPLLYLAGGAILSFAFGRRITGSPGVAWSCAILFLFHPLLDSVCYRPMPDLSEGVWGACIMLAWWHSMRAAKLSGALLFAMLTGAAVFIAEANRITAVFMVPILVLATLLFFRRRFHWLLVAGFAAAIFYGIQAWVYHELFGDWLHDIHANLGNKGAKGIETLAIWSLPFRFFDSLWNGNPLAPFYCILAVAGIYAAAGGKLGASTDHPSKHDPRTILTKVVALWFIVLYLEYACAPQGFKGGWNPLIRDADRFLCGLVVPMSVLAALGVQRIFNWAKTRQPILGRLHPAAIGVVSLLTLMFFTSRKPLDLEFVPKMKAYIASLPPKTEIFTHDGMRFFSFLIHPNAARTLTWHHQKRIINQSPELEAMAARSQQFWYVRKLVWLTTRKKLEKKAFAEQIPMGSYFTHPERDWVLSELLARGDTPDLVFYRRRTPQDPPPLILEAGASEFGTLFPRLPAQWEKAQGQPTSQRWEVPGALRGQFARIEMEAASPQVEAVTIQLRFMAGETLKAEYLLKPYLHTEPGKEFFAFEIPPDAEACDVQFLYSKNAKSVRFTGFRAFLEKPARSW